MLLNVFNPYEPTKDNNFTASIYEQADHIQRVVNRLAYVEKQLRDFNYYNHDARFSLRIERENLWQQMEQFHAHIQIQSTRNRKEFGRSRFDGNAGQIANYVRYPYHKSLVFGVLNNE